MRFSTASFGFRSRVHVVKALLAACVVGAACAEMYTHRPGGGGGGDCLPQGTALCGPSWDRDGDTISTATETNSTNRIDNFPIAGFYSFDTLQWDINLSRARGLPNDFTGLLDYGMNLRDVGAGRVHYLGCDQVDTDDWGTGHLLRIIEASGRDWADSLLFKSYPRLQSGDMSLRTGGFFGTCGLPHEWHRNGLDVDVRYIGKLGEGPLDICSSPSVYDTTATLSLFNTIVFLNGDGNNGRPFVVVVFADTTCLGFMNNPNDPYIVHDSDHRDHFHVSIRDPDGTSN